MCLAHYLWNVDKRGKMASKPSEKCLDAGIWVLWCSTGTALAAGDYCCVTAAGVCCWHPGTPGWAPQQHGLRVQAQPYKELQFSSTTDRELRCHEQCNQWVLPVEGQTPLSSLWDLAQTCVAKHCAFLRVQSRVALHCSTVAEGSKQEQTESSEYPLCFHGSSPTTIPLPSKILGKSKRLSPQCSLKSISIKDHTSLQTKL